MAPCIYILSGSFFLAKRSLKLAMLDYRSAEYGCDGLKALRHDLGRYQTSTNLTAGYVSRKARMVRHDLVPPVMSVYVARRGTGPRIR